MKRHLPCEGMRRSLFSSNHRCNINTLSISPFREGHKSCLLFIELQSILLKTFNKRTQNAFSIVFILAANDGVICVAEKLHLSCTVLFDNVLKLLINHIMGEYIREDWAANTSLRHALFADR